MASYIWSIEPDRLVLDFDDEPEEQESSAVTPGSVEQKRVRSASSWRCGTGDESQKCGPRPDRSPEVGHSASNAAGHAACPNRRSRARLWGGIASADHCVKLPRSNSLRRWKAEIMGSLYDHEAAPG